MSLLNYLPPAPDVLTASASRGELLAGAAWVLETCATNN